MPLGAASLILYQQESHTAAFFADSVGYDYLALQMPQVVSGETQFLAHHEGTIVFNLMPEQQILCRMCDNSVNKAVHALAAILLVCLFGQPPKKCKNEIYSYQCFAFYMRISHLSHTNGTVMF